MPQIGWRDKCWDALWRGLGANGALTDRLNKRYGLCSAEDEDSRPGSMTVSDDVRRQEGAVSSFISLNRGYAVTARREVVFTFVHLFIDKRRNRREEA